MSPWLRFKLLAPTLVNIQDRRDEELAGTLRNLRYMLVVPIFVALIANMFGGWLGATLVLLALAVGVLPLVLSGRIVAELNAREQRRAEQAALTEALYMQQVAQEEVADFASDEDADDEDDDDTPPRR